MTQSELHALLDRVAETVIELQQASMSYQRIADEMRATVQEAKETAELARATANSASASISGLVTAHQSLEKRVAAIEGKVL